MSFSARVARRITCCRSCPVILEKRGDTRVRDAHLAYGIVLIDLEFVPVIPVETVLCADPDEAVSVLQNLVYGILREAVIDSEMADLVLVGSRPGREGGAEDQRCQKCQMANHETYYEQDAEALR